MSNTQENMCQISLELTSPQRENYEKAAAAKGQTLSEWATNILDKCANEDLGGNATTELSPEAFEAFQEMLDTPRPAAVEELLKRKVTWE